MPKDAVVADVITHAVTTARVDRTAPSGPPDERVRFDPEALRRVMALASAAQDREQVAERCWWAIKQWLDVGDIDRAMAALYLRDRVVASSGRTYRPSDAGFEAI